MRQMLDNLLHWSKDQLTGNSETQKEPIDIAPLLERIVEFYGSMANAKNVRLKYEEPESVILKVDPNYFGLILRNIASNAIKYSPTGGEVSITTTTSERLVTICVSDEGKGMPPEVLENIKKGRPVKSSSGTTNEKGTGLGIMLVHEYAELNGIEVRFESEQGKGTKACIDIPRP